MQPPTPSQRSQQYGHPPLQQPQTYHHPGLAVKTHLQAPRVCFYVDPNSHMMNPNAMHFVPRTNYSQFPGAQPVRGYYPSYPMQQGPQQNTSAAAAAVVSNGQQQSPQMMYPQTVGPAPMTYPGAPVSGHFPQYQVPQAQIPQQQVIAAGQGQTVSINHTQHPPGHQQPSQQQQQQVTPTSIGAHHHHHHQQQQPPRPAPTETPPNVLPSGAVSAPTSVTVIAAPPAGIQSMPCVTGLHQLPLHPQPLQQQFATTHFPAATRPTGHKKARGHALPIINPATNKSIFDEDPAPSVASKCDLSNSSESLNIKEPPSKEDFQGSVESSEINSPIVSSRASIDSSISAKVKQDSSSSSVVGGMSVADEFSSKVIQIVAQSKAAADDEDADGKAKEQTEKVANDDQVIDVYQSSSAITAPPISIETTNSSSSPSSTSSASEKIHSDSFVSSVITNSATADDITTRKHPSVTSSNGSIITDNKSISDMDTSNSAINHVIGTMDEKQTEKSKELKGPDEKVPSTTKEPSVLQESEETSKRTTRSNEQTGAEKPVSTPAKSSRTLTNSTEDSKVEVDSLHYEPISPTSLPDTPKTKSTINNNEHEVEATPQITKTPYDTTPNHVSGPSTSQIPYRKQNSNKNFQQNTPKVQASRKAEVNKESDGGSDVDLFNIVPSTVLTPEVASDQPTLPQEVAASTTFGEKESDDSTPSSEKDIYSTSDSNLPDAGEETEENEKVTEGIVDVHHQKSQVKLKYDYKEDQWSPINLEGKKRYDRDFLVQLQQDPLCLIKPSELPKMEIIKDKPNSIAIAIAKVSPMIKTDFMPSFGKTTVPRTPSLRKSNGHDKRGVRGGPVMGNQLTPQRIVIPSLTEKVVLHQTDNAWKPVKLSNTDTKPIEELARKVRAILNKLCPQNFEILLKKFNELPISTLEELKLCMELIFEKAVDEPGFSGAYAQMCDDLRKKEIVGEDGHSVMFRKLLVMRCQQEFEKNYLDEAVKKKYVEDLENAETEEQRKEIKAVFEDKERTARRRSLGNIRFIGELYKLNNLTPKIMHECIYKLLRSHNPPEEEAIESLCGLLTTIGKKLEAETVQYGNLELIFVKIHEVIDGKTVSSRLRFMLKDLVDLRRNQWRPRRDVAGPKTIEEIHKDVEKDRTQQKLLNSDYGGSSGGSKSMGARDRGGGGGLLDGRKRSSRMDEKDGWTSVPAKSGTKPHEQIDVTKFDFKMSPSCRVPGSEGISLGPSSRYQFSSWSRGSGSRIMPQYKDEHSSMPMMGQTSNRFGALSSAEPSEERDSSPNTAERPRIGQSLSTGIFGRSSRGPSAESERLNVLQSKNQGTGAGGTANGPQLPIFKGGHPRDSATARSTPRSDADILENQKCELKGGQDLPEKEKIRNVLDEYVKSKIKQKAMEEFILMANHQTASNIVRIWIEHGLDRTPAMRKLTGPLLVDLVIMGHLQRIQIVEGFKSVLVEADGLLYDVPKLWEYLGEIITPMLLHGSRTFNMSFLPDTASSFPKEKFHNLSPNYVAGVCCVMATEASEEEVKMRWALSGLTWNSFIKTSEDIEDFVKKKTLEYTHSPSFAHDHIRRCLDWLMVDARGSKDFKPVFDWIESYVENKKYENWFIRILTTAVISSVLEGHKKDTFADMEAMEGRLDECVPILKRYLDSNCDRELQALYAVQALMHHLQHPNKLLCTIFRSLNGNDVVSTESFNNWKESSDPAEQEGKGVCLAATTQFLTWLVETEED